MKLTTLLGIATIAACSTVFAQAPSPDQARTASQDTKFLEKANQGSVDEIDLAQIALKKATNPDVKDFAQKMVQDHQKLIDDMRPFDTEAGVQPPAHPDAMAEALKLKLDVLSGDAFDKAYIKAMVEDHHKDLQEFLSEEKSTGYPAFKSAVTKGAGVVREHLQMIDQIAKKNGVAPAPVPPSGM
jgi:putative membrane protein